MNQRQLPPPPSRALGHRARPRSLWGSFWTVALHPSLFYRSLPILADTRQWLWAGLIILALVGINAVRHAELLAAAESGGGAMSGQMPPDFGMMPPEGDMGRGEVFGGPMDFGGIPPDAVGADGPDTGGDSNISKNLTTALVAASGVIVGWLILTVLLCEVSLFNSHIPRLGQNFQIAIWSSIPLAIMAGLQMIYWSAGGDVGAAGISGLVERVPGYDGFSLFGKSLVLSLFSRLTLFWLWSLALVYVGGRQALAGKSWAVMIVVIAWVAVSVVAPVVTGTIQAEETLDIELIDPSALTPDNENGISTEPLDGQNMGAPFIDESGEPVEAAPERPETAPTMVREESALDTNREAELSPLQLENGAAGD